MSNKAPDRLIPIDSRLRSLFPIGMRDGVDCEVTISLLCGFELFNTRAYHNYETWASGYRVEALGVVASAEDLDDALTAWVKAYDRSGVHFARWFAGLPYDWRAGEVR